MTENQDKMTAANDLPELIHQAYEATPHADDARLTAIRQRITLPAQAQSNNKTIRPHTPWWVIGLVLAAGTAAAWWVIQKQDNDIEQSNQETTIAIPQSAEQQTSIEPKAGPASEDEPNADLAVTENTDKDEQEVSKTDRSKREKSTVIFSREVF